MTTPITITHPAVFIPHDGRARCSISQLSRDAAEKGSDQLRWAMRHEFKAMALRTGITVNDAALLLMNGEGL